MDPSSGDQGNMTMTKLRHSKFAYGSKFVLLGLSSEKVRRSQLSPDQAIVAARHSTVRMSGTYCLRPPESSILKKMNSAV
jgi:hypothetical protein